MMYRLLKNEWCLLALIIISFLIVDKYLFNYTPSEEDIAYSEFLKENVQDSARILNQTLKNQKEYTKQLEIQEKEYQRILNKNKELKQLIREHECGKNLDLCRRDESGNFMVYKDIVGVSTVGYGNTSFPKNNPNAISVSERQVEILLDQDLDLRIKQFKNDPIYLTHKKNLELHPRTMDMYIDLIFVVGYTAFKYKKNKDGTYSTKPTDLYKEALNNPFSDKAMKLIRSYNRAGGKEVKGLTNRHLKTQTVAMAEREAILNKRTKQKGMTINEYFNVYSGI